MKKYAHKYLVVTNNFIPLRHGEVLSEVPHSHDTTPTYLSLN